MSRQFSEKSASRIARATRWAEQHYGDKQPTQQPTGQIIFRMFLGKTSATGIPARSGTTPGEGDVTLWTIDTAGPTLSEHESKEATPAAVTKTCYNLSTTAVGNSVYVMIMQEGIKGTFWCLWEDC